MAVNLAAGFSRAWRPALLAGVLALVVSGVSVRGAALEAGPVSEEQVKAAFLLNFPRFVQWPAPGSGPIVIGIAGDEAFADIVTRTVRGRSINGRNLQARRLATGDDPSGCQVLFVGVMPARDAAEFLRRVRGPVLTVGETVQFMRDGGMVRLYVENNNVRFQVSEKNAEGAGLKISSQLMALAAR